MVEKRKMRSLSAAKVGAIVLLLLTSGVLSIAQSPKRGKSFTCRIVSVESQLPETAVAVTEARSIMKIDCGKRGIFTRDVTDGWPVAWAGLDVGDLVRGQLVRGGFYPLQSQPKP